MKQETYKIWKIGMLVSLGLLIIFSIIVVFNPPSWFFENSNKAKMTRVCAINGGEPYIYKVGWSEACGFDVYRGTCIKYGQIVGDVDLLLVEGNSFPFENLPNPHYPEYDGVSNPEEYNQEFQKETERWESEVCDILNPLGER